MSVEQLLFLVLFVLIPLVNLLARWLRKRVPEPPIPAPERREPIPILPRPTVLSPVPALAPQHPRATSAERLPDQPLARPAQRRTRLSPREVRRGIVLMTILGPCRALEPRVGEETGV
jgi:hypothetical protein